MTAWGATLALLVRLLVRRGILAAASGAVPVLLTNAVILVIKCQAECRPTLLDERHDQSRALVAIVPGEGAEPVHVPAAQAQLDGRQDFGNALAGHGLDVGKVQADLRGARAGEGGQSLAACRTQRTFVSLSRWE